MPPDDHPPTPPEKREPAATPVPPNVAPEPAPSAVIREHPHEETARSAGLRHVEAELFSRHRDALRGDVLELLPSGGPMTAELVGAARSYTGIGPSAALISVCRHFHRSGTFVRGDLDDLPGLGEHEFDAIVAGHAVIDLLPGDQRALLLGHLHRLLRPGGVLIFSSHNGATSTDVPEPAQPRRGRLPRLFRDRRAFPEDRAGEQGQGGFAAASGDARISRDDQDAQLTEHGFWLLDCRDLEDRPVPAGESGDGSDELHYVARPV